MSKYTMIECRSYISIPNCLGFDIVWNRTQATKYVLKGTLIIKADYGRAGFNDRFYLSSACKCVYDYMCSKFSLLFYW